ncbi:MAG: hypothetical protein ACK556_25575, partial [Pseudanabaena sp.]
MCLLNLADKFPGLLSQALEVSQTAFQDEQIRVLALTINTDKFPELLPQALAYAESQDVSTCTDILVRITLNFSELIPQALEAIQNIDDQGIRALYLVSLAIKFSELIPQALEAIPQALEAIQNIDDPTHLPDVQSSIFMISFALAGKYPDFIPQILGAFSRTVVYECLFDPCGVDLISMWLYPLGTSLIYAAANELTPDQIPQILEVANAIDDGYVRSKFLLGLSLLKFPELLSKTLEAAKAIENEKDRSRVLDKLSHKLTPDTPDLLLIALEVAKTIENENDRSRV